MLRELINYFKGRKKVSDDKIERSELICILKQLENAGVEIAAYGFLQGFHTPFTKLEEECFEIKDYPKKIISYLEDNFKYEFSCKHSVFLDGHLLNHYFDISGRHQVSDLRKNLFSREKDWRVVMDEPERMTIEYTVRKQAEKDDS